MTEKRARTLHRAMWHWLAKHPDIDKAQWPGWRLSAKNVDVLYEWGNNQCFACLIATSCFRCPIKEKAGICNRGNDLWTRYLRLLRSLSDTSPDEWATVCNTMADAWREVS